MRTTNTVIPLRQRMIEDMTARNLGRHSQRSHIDSCRRFAAFLKRSPDTATADDVRLFQLHLVESGLGISNRNRIMTGVKFLFRVTLRRHDLAAEIYHLKEPEKLPLTMSPNEAERLLTMAHSLRDQVMLSLGYGCGLRAGEIVRLRAGDIDSAQMIIRIVQSKGRKDRHVMLPEELLLSLRQWWKVRLTRFDAGVPPGEGETQFACPSDEDQAPLIFFGVEPVSARAAGRLRQDTNALVVANGLNVHLGSLGQRTDGH
jgi:integrase/recombinase XerD